MCQLANCFRVVILQLYRQEFVFSLFDEFFFFKFYRRYFCATIVVVVLVIFLCNLVIVFCCIQFILILLPLHLKKTNFLNLFKLTHLKLYHEDIILFHRPVYFPKLYLLITEPKCFRHVYVDIDIYFIDN